MADSQFVVLENSSSKYLNKIMNKIGLCFSIICFCNLYFSTYSQSDISKEATQKSTYTELPDTKQWARVKGTIISWGSTNTRYEKSVVPQIKVVLKNKIIVWKGERVSAQAVIWTSNNLSSLSYEITDFKMKNGNHIIPASAVTSGFVRYVMTDELNKDKNGACGNRPDPTQFDSSLVADPIDHHLKSINVNKMNSQSIWLSCDVPVETKPGLYQGELIIKNINEIIGRLSLDIQVINKILPLSENSTFHLDLWQNPFSVARIQNVKLWSDEHFEELKPVMKMLADAGQKVITTSIIHKPWNAQTEDYFETMITWMKRADGTWLYDYTIFDKWVEFMMSLGVDKQINCYTMVPWALNFQYYDQATNSIQFIKTAPGDKEYEELWIPMLKSFSKHLKDKGWFDISTIAMDERPMDVMQKTIKIIRKADPDFKISLAGNYHSEIEPDIYDYSISLSQKFPEEVLARRKKENKLSTYYTSCTHNNPNTFTFSDPAESVWLGFYLAKDEVDGFLRWAYNSWVEDPLVDSRFRSWAAGDTYLVYPEGRSSIRFEKMIEGIQCFEKIVLLKKEYNKNKNIDKIEELNQILKMFELTNFPNTAAHVTVEKAQSLLNKMTD